MGVGEFPSTGRSLKRKTFRFFLHFVLLGGFLVCASRREETEDANEIDISLGGG